ncbi:MAG: type II toxin-antitoxin system Phd/YefM family antitoxin [Propionibacteriaceae bacterium]|nr:type II toxin-antitoxin system Phd/YefM family antitoxin [Propionibacteriaceae bacterium]
MTTQWPVRDAKAQFSELLRTCLEQGPQVITKRGKETAVVVSTEEWHLMRKAPEPTLKQLLTTDQRRADP